MHRFEKVDKIILLTQFKVFLFQIAFNTMEL